MRKALTKQYHRWSGDRLADQQPTGYRAAKWLRDVADLLEKKSDSYGDSIGDPVRVFSKAGQSDGVRVRIDDKLSRIKNGSDKFGENDLADLVGYVALLAVSKE